jgi:hypothetical protein
MGGILMKEIIYKLIELMIFLLGAGLSRNIVTVSLDDIMQIIGDGMSLNQTALYYELYEYRVYIDTIIGIVFWIVAALIIDRIKSKEKNKNIQKNIDQLAYQLKLLKQEQEQKNSGGLSRILCF